MRWANRIVPACGGEEVVHLFLVVGIALAYIQHGRIRPGFWIQVAAIVPATLIASPVRCGPYPGNDGIDRIRTPTRQRGDF